MLALNNEENDQVTEGLPEDTYEILNRIYASSTENEIHALMMLRQVKANAEELLEEAELRINAIMDLIASGPWSH